MFDYLRARLLEPSTWRGLVLISAALGVVLTPEQQEAIVTAGLLMAGLIGAAFPDKHVKENQQ